MKKHTDQGTKRFLTILTVVGLWTMTALAPQLAVAEGHAADLAPAATGEVFPKPDWRDAPDPLTSSNAIPGGDMTSTWLRNPAA